MILKGTLAAGLIAAVLAFAPTPASADTNVRIGIGFGNWPGGACAGHFSNRQRCWPRYRRGHWVPYYYPYRGYYAPARYGFNCNEARWIVREHGFTRISTERCGRIHVFVGWRNGHPHLIRIRRANGAIISVNHI
jgi:hypothetical protein